MTRKYSPEHVRSKYHVSQKLKRQKTMFNEIEYEKNSLRKGIWSIL